MKKRNMKKDHGMNNQERKKQLTDLVKRTAVLRDDILRTRVQNRRAYEQTCGKFDVEKCVQECHVENSLDSAAVDLTRAIIALGEALKALEKGDGHEEAH